MARAVTERALLSGSAPARAPTFPGRAAALCAGHASLAGVADPAPRSAGLVSAAGLLVHRGPGAALRLVLADALFPIAFLDMVGHPLLLVRVLRFVSAWHVGLLTAGP